MSIWGNDSVYVTKDSERRVWVVSTSKIPRQHLVTIPWADAFKSFPHAADYSEAIATCQSHRSTALTRDEEDTVMAELEPVGRPAGGVATPVGTSTTPPGPPDKAPKKVLSLDDFRRRKQK